MKQGQLFDLSSSLRSRVIGSRRDFDALLDGFAAMKAIAYVASPELLLDLLDKRGYRQLELLIGNNIQGLALSNSFRKELAQKKREVTERLLNMVESGALRILIPPRVIHTKLYIVEDGEKTRIVMTSANLTETAREARKQVNYAWYTDLSREDPWLASVLTDFEIQCKDAEPFMGDLLQLLHGHAEDERQDIIDAWLTGGVIEEDHAETKRVLQEIAASVLDEMTWREEPILNIRLPESEAAKREIQRLLAPARLSDNNRELSLDKSTYVRYVQEEHRLPLMRVDRGRRRVTLGIDGSIRSLTEPLPENEQVNAALEHVEGYLQTVDLGQAGDSRFVKMSMFEALLYFLFSPFAHDYMEARRRRYEAIDSRGPRFLYIYGRAQNGKTTFLRFALKLLAGQRIEPLPGTAFSKTKVLTSALFGTVFPLAFDDVTPSRDNRSFEAVLKSFWEVWWRQGHSSPQIVLSSNTESLKDWAKSRIKRLDFDVFFTPNEDNRYRLSRLLSVDNNLFKWFSWLYLEHEEDKEIASDDELRLARKVMEELYAHANRKLPDYFPSRPIEEIYDPGRRRWDDLLHQMKKAGARRKGNRIFVQFLEEMQYHEVREYESDLPQSVKYQRKGKTLVIESPREFYAWLDGERPHNLVRRLIRR